jgi:hypothetical protein
LLHIDAYRNPLMRIRQRFDIFRIFPGFVGNFSLPPGTYGRHPTAQGNGFRANWPLNLTPCQRSRGAILAKSSNIAQTSEVRDAGRKYNSDR